MLRQKYNTVLQDNPLIDLTGMFGEPLGTNDYYNQLATETQQDAAVQQTTAEQNATNQAGTTTATAGTGENLPATDPAPIDPRLQWTAFAFADEFSFPEGALPAEAMLDNLFALTPTGTESFSTNTIFEATPIIEDGTAEGLHTTKNTGLTTAITFLQEWVSPSEWIVTQSITKSFNSAEAGTHEDGRTDTIGRTGFITLTISVINGTRSIVTYSIRDSFSYADALEWDLPPADPTTEDPTTTGDPVAAAPDDTGDPTAEPVEQGPIDKGSFSSGFNTSESMTITVETILITLPDGRSAKQYNFGYSTLSTFDSFLDAASQFSRQAGTLKKFAAKPQDETLGTSPRQGENETPSTQEPTLPASAAANGTDTTDPNAENSDDDSELEVEQGGNGSAISFSGTSKYKDNFSKNFGLNLSAIVPEGESLDDAIVTGTGSFGVATGYESKGGSRLNIQLQTSSGDPSTGNDNHEYISFVSSADQDSAVDFNFDIDFDFTGENAASTDETTTDTMAALNPDGTAVDPPPTDPPTPNFEFTYSTGGSDGGGSVLLYSKSATIGDWTNTETLTATGTFSFAGSFDFSFFNGITVFVQSSGSGTIEYKSISVGDYGDADFSQPTEYYGSWHYPQMRNELTVTTTGSFAADVTLTFGLLTGLNVDATYSADYTTVTEELQRTDWAYWETSVVDTYDYSNPFFPTLIGSTPVNNYWERGHGQTVTTTTATFKGNLTDGFDADVKQAWKFTGDVEFGGTKGLGTPPEPPEEQGWFTTENILDGVQLALDIGGLIPGFGEPLDAINAGISLGRGNYADAALAIAAMIPIGGQAATAAKLAGKVGEPLLKNIDKADEVAGFLGHYADEFAEAAEDLACFPAGTPVLTPLGYVPIEDIRKGDFILSRPEDDVEAPLTRRKVEVAYVREAEVLQLSIGGQTITTTAEHPFWVRDFGWTPAAALEADDELATAAGSWIRLEAIRYTGTWTTVYNIRVQEDHTYFIGQPNWGFAVWVHNTHIGLPGDALVVRGGQNTPELVAKGMGTHPSGITGGNRSRVGNWSFAELTNLRHHVHVAEHFGRCDRSSAA